MQLNESGKNNFSKQIHETWILPEVEKRKELGTLPKYFKIYRCLIKFPKNEKYIIEFNDEIKFIAKIKLPKGKTMLKGSF